MGYLFITANNVFTAAQGVFTKQKLDSKDLGKYGVLFYNCLFSVIPIFALCYFTGEFDKVNYYSLSLSLIFVWSLEVIWLM